MGLRARQATGFKTVYENTADGKKLVSRRVMVEKSVPTMRHPTRKSISGEPLMVRVPTGTNTPDPNKGISWVTLPSDATMEKRGFKWDNGTERWVKEPKTHWTIKANRITYSNFNDYREAMDFLQEQRAAAHRAECDANRMRNGVPINVPIGGLYAIAFDEDGDPTEWERCMAADVLPHLQSDFDPSYNQMFTPVEGGGEE